MLSKKILIILIILFSYFGLINQIQLNNSVKAETLYVGGIELGNYSTIQDAIDNSTNGDNIFVYTGIYYENLLVNKSINLIGEDKNTTRIDGNGLTILTIIADEVKVSSFKIQNNNSYPFSLCLTSGIFIYSNNNSIYDNIISNNQIGISISGRFCYPFINYDSNNNISFRNPYNNTIFANTISENIFGIILESSNNSFYLNNLINNTENVNDSYDNNWYYESYGNYYDEYSGTDLNNDGIGDEPYSIPGGNNTDDYPLMLPYNSEKINEQQTVNPEAVFTMLALGVVISIIFVLPIAYYWRKKYFT